MVLHAEQFKNEDTDKDEIVIGESTPERCAAASSAINLVTGSPFKCGLFAQNQKDNLCTYPHSCPLPHPSFVRPTARV